MTVTLASASHFVTIDGDIAARVHFAGGPPVMWVHGYTLDSGTWAELWNELPGWSHVGIDLPGHGGSPSLAPDADLPALAERIGRLAVDLGVHHLVALSFGTTLAIEIAGRFPETIRTLVLGAPSLAGGPQDPGVRLRYRELMLVHRQLGPGPHLGALWMQESSEVFRYARRRQELWQLLRATVGRHRWSELQDGSMQRLLDHHQDDALLRRITAETLLLIGEHEMPAFAACAAHIQAVLPSSRRVDISAVGHLCLLEAPQTAGALIRAHLSQSGSNHPRPGARHDIGSAGADPVR